MNQLARLFRKLFEQAPAVDSLNLPSPPQPSDAERALRLANMQLRAAAVREDQYRADYVERCCELEEARAMAGPGPWLPYDARAALASTPGLLGKEGAQQLRTLRETSPLVSQGAFGDIELALQNVEWRREINLSWMEFSRWGIQQIMLISRLYYIKNPIVRRLIDIAAAYVFGRGVEVSCDDEDANEVLREAFEANKKVLGQHGLVQLERQKFYDGNLFFAFFTDTANTGGVQIRNIEATEIIDIVTNPEDADTPWYYRRQWIQRNFDVASGQVITAQCDAWYPDIKYQPAQRPATIGSYPVMWDVPILHRKCGHVARWRFGCPIVYPMLDWAKEARKFLEACATVKRALAQIAMVMTTKGGQQAIEGAKQQLETTVGPQAPIWDTNPTPVNASIFVSGTGTTMKAFQTSGAGGNPEEVRQYKLMCCCVVGVPETFLADVSTGNLATATTLDRPTELVFLERQQSWQEDLVTIAQYFLNASKSAPSGKLRDSLRKRDIEPGRVTITEAPKALDSTGRMVYLSEAKAAAKPQALKITAIFPAIREGDLQQLVAATVQALTLGNTMGQVNGIDEKTGVLQLMRLLGIEDAEDIVEAMYPEGEYDADRTEEEPAATPTPFGGGAAAPPVPGQEDDEEPEPPMQPGGKKKQVPVNAHSRNAPKRKAVAKESLYLALAKLQELSEQLERNADATLSRP